MRNIFLLTLNTLKVTFRKKGSVIVFFVLPLIGILVSMGVYKNVGSGSLRLGVLNRDNSVLTADLIASLGGENRFKITGIDESALDNAVTTGRLDCVLIIPRGFGAGVINNHMPRLEVVSIKGEAATAWVSNYLNTYCTNLRDMAAAAGGSKAAFDSIYSASRQEKPSLVVSPVQDNSASKGATAQSIGFLILFMMMGTGGTAQMIIKEKINKTFYRICAAPVSGKAYVAGNVLANLAIVTVQVLLTLLLLTSVFHINTHAPSAQLFLVLTAFGLAAIGLGLLTTAFAGDSRQAHTMQLLLITPSCMLAGCFWPLEIMPATARRVADFLPQTWAIEAIHQLQEGGSLGQISVNLFIIMAFALAFFLAAAYGFSRKDGVKSFI